MSSIQSYTKYVFPSLKLHAFERLIILYLFLERQIGPGQPTTVKLREFSDFVGAGEHQTRVYARKLRERRVLVQLEPTRSGFVVELSAPEEIPGVKFDEAPPSIDIEEINFFDRQHIKALLKRQDGRCVYSLRILSESDAEIDHIVPQAIAHDNSHRNVVACTFAMNKQKGSRDYKEFLRDLYRSGLLSETELQTQLAFIEGVRRGEFPPPLD